MEVFFDPEKGDNMNALKIGSKKRIPRASRVPTRSVGASTEDVGPSKS